MKRKMFVILMALAMAFSAFCAKREIPILIHTGGPQSENVKEDRCPITLPLAVYYDPDTSVLEVWCDDDNIQAEVYVYDENGALEAYSAYMNVTLTLSSSSSHSLHLVGDGWEADADI